jgi:hypothetical protein
VNFYLLFQAVASLPLTVNRLLLQALLIAFCGGELPHSCSPAGFAYLEFSWMPASSLFSSVKSYQPVRVAGLVYSELAWGATHPSLSC